MEFNYQLQPGLEVFDRKLITDGEAEVTIITPFYNGGKTIEQTFNCVMNQTFPWFEWLLLMMEVLKRKMLNYLNL